MSLIVTIIAAIFVSFQTAYYIDHAHYGQAAISVIIPFVMYLGWIMDCLNDIRKNTKC
jgi:hypothetical protein